MQIDRFGDLSSIVQPYQTTVDWSYPFISLKGRALRRFPWVGGENSLDLWIIRLWRKYTNKKVFYRVPHLPDSSRSVERAGRVPLSTCAVANSSRRENRVCWLASR